MLKLRLTIKIITQQPFKNRVKNTLFRLIFVKIKGVTKLGLTKKHISLFCADAVKNICNPLFEYAPLHYFHHAKLYDNGLLSILVTHPEFHKHFWDKKYNESLFPNYKPGIFFNESYANSALKDARDFFDIDNMLMIIKRFKGYFEVFGFGGKAGSTETLQFYLKNPDALERFTHYFNHVGSKLIKKAEKNLILSEGYKPLFINQEKESDILERAHGNTVILSKRERECLILLSKGKSMKKIADELLLSPRTIEHYVENIKTKFGVRTKDDLLEKFTSLNTFLIKNC